MSTADTTAAIESGSEFVDFWNEVLVPKFFRFKHILVDGLTHHSAAVMPWLPVEQGDAALDVGCGFGDTAIQLAERVGTDGRVTGIDCCRAFLDVARADAAAAGLANVSFVEGDAQAHAFAPEYDFVFSRFGTMFFENPVRGLKNMRTAMKPGAAMTMIVWRTIDDNPWFGLPKSVVLNFLPPPGEDARSCGPGPFSMADQATVTGMLRSAGYVDPDFKRVDAPVLVGKTPEDSVAFQLMLGPAGEVFREAGDVAEQRRGEIEAALAEAITPYMTEDGVVMGSSSWIITARAPR